MEVKKKSLNELNINMEGTKEWISKQEDRT